MTPIVAITLPNQDIVINNYTHKNKITKGCLRIGFDTMIFQPAITVSCSLLNQQQTLLCQTPFIMPSFCCWEGLPNNAFTHICHGSHCGTWKSLRDWHWPRSAFTIGSKEWATFLLWTRAPISSLEIRTGYSPAHLCCEHSRVFIDSVARPAFPACSILFHQ